MSSQKLRVAELDFDSIKENLKEFLRSKPEFTDYNFEGSGLSIMLDVLAYNTHYNAVLANLATKEHFLDTATKRSTVSLHAKRLSYVPVSATAPSAIVNLEVFPTGTPGTLTIGRGATFNGRGGNQVFTFVTNEAKTVQRSADGRYVFENLRIYEGAFQKFRYVFNENQNSQSFQIPSENVDTNLLTVKVQRSLTNTETEVFNLANDIALVKADSSVYYLKVNEQGFYEVYFGDNVLGKRPEDGNVVILEYVVTNKTLANDISSFTFADSVQGNTNTLVTLVQKAVGGAEPEDLESIKFNAQKQTQTQNRAVVADDYKALIPQIYPVDSINVWGGESNDPPVYGKVFIAIRPKLNAEVLTQTTKQFIKDKLIKEKNVLTIIPEIIDPDFVDVIVDSNVYYDDTIGTVSAETVKFFVISSIADYSTNNLNKFEKDLRYSDLVAMIDEADPSIVSNITNLRMRKGFLPDFLTTKKYSISYDNPIRESSNKLQSITSSKFRVPGFNYDLFFEDENGVMKISYRDENNVKLVYRDNAGTVDYSLGKIEFGAINIESSEKELIEFTCIPLSNDLFSIRDKILRIKTENVNVNVIAEEKDKTKRISTPSI